MPVSHVECCDCMEFMARYPDKHFELAIVDPPYGINAAEMNMGDGYYGKGRKDRLSGGAGKLKTRKIQIMRSDWDNMPPDEYYFEQLFKISRNQVIWGGNYFKLPTTRGIICWDKQQPWPNFSAWEMAWTSFDCPAKLFRFGNFDSKIHPTQKPIALYKWLLHNYAKPGDKILDTHLGSGSSRIDAWDMGYDFYGCELDQEYFDASVERFERFRAQLKLDLEAI